MKTIAMIPVRMGSTRVPRKNLRILNGKPLVAWIIQAAIAARCFDEIYLNSEDDIFAEIAKDYGISFYKRSEQLASDSSSNDDFMYDFLQNVECDNVIQLLATSPFITSKTIKDFVDTMNVDNYAALVSVKDISIECVYCNDPVNFDDKLHTKPSQELTPVKAYACGIMGWKANSFKLGHQANIGAYHGRNLGLYGYYEITGYETVDIDCEEDFQLAEAIMVARTAGTKEPQYYQIKDQLKKVGDLIQTDVNDILTRDGVMQNVLDRANFIWNNIADIIITMSKASSWSYRLVNTPTGSATLICQNPAEGNREHYHPDISEWWLIIKGAYDFNIEGKITVARQGDVIFVDKGKKHQITAIGGGPAIRLAVSLDGAEHVYTN